VLFHAQHASTPVLGIWPRGILYAPDFQAVRASPEGYQAAYAI